MFVLQWRRQATDANACHGWTDAGECSETLSEVIAAMDATAAIDRELRADTGTEYRIVQRRDVEVGSRMIDMGRQGLI